MMSGKLRNLYRQVRGWPLIGLVVSQGVWTIKGALGLPISRPTPSSTAPSPPSAPDLITTDDVKLRVALAAAEALGERLAQRPSAHVAPRRSTRPDDDRAGSVSVIVNTLDRADWLDRTLWALAYQRHPAFEVIVVAGPCEDHTAEVVARHGGRIRAAACPVANLAVSRNIGLAMACGDIVAFLDDDAVPEPDWLQRLTALYADAGVGGVGGYIRDDTGLDYQCRVMVCDRFGRSAEAGDIRRARLDPPGPSVERYLTLTGTNSSFRRSALLGIGGFDEAYAYFLDETDVCLRLAEAGWRLAVAPEAEVHHAYAPNAQRRADRAPLSLAACVRSKAYFTMRNAAPHHGLPAAADHLQAYVDRLRHDTAWRREHGILNTAETDRLLSEIDVAIVSGVRAALDGPRRLMPDVASSLADAIRPSSSRKAALRRDVDQLHLCLLCQDYPTGGPEQDDKPPGGIAIWTQALAEATAALGHEVSIIAQAGSAGPSARFQACEDGGVWVHRLASRVALPSMKAAGLTAGLPASIADPALAAAREVQRLMSRRRFDLVMGPLWDLEPCALIGQSNIAVAASLHTAYAQMIPFKPEWDDAYRRSHVDKVVAGERRLLQHAPHVLANSHAAAREIGAALGVADLAKRASVIPHGLPDLAHGVTPPRRSSGIEILFVGRLEARKGVDVLLAAAPRLLSARADVRITLVGEDVSPPGAKPWRDVFRREFAGAPWRERLCFEGPLSRPGLLQRFAACDIVVVPSRYESFGLTALEAMIFSKPCVAADVGGLREVVADGVGGLLVPPGDVDALAEAVLRLMCEPDLRRAMGAAGRRRYEERFTAAAMAQAFGAWARTLCAASGRVAAA